MNWIIASETIEGRKLFAEIWYSKKPTNLGYKSGRIKKKYKIFIKLGAFYVKIALIKGFGFLE